MLQVNQKEKTLNETQNEQGSDQTKNSQNFQILLFWTKDKKKLFGISKINIEVK